MTLRQDLNEGAPLVWDIAVIGGGIVGLATASLSIGRQIARWALARLS